MAGTKTDIHFYRRDVGTGSSSHDFDGDFKMMLRTSSSEARFSESNTALVWQVIGGGLVSGRQVRIASILLTKKLLKQEATCRTYWQRVLAGVISVFCS